MRCLLLAVVAGLAVLAVGIHAEETVADDDAVEAVDIDLLSNERLSRMLGDLFEDEDFVDREGRAIESPAEEEKSVVSPKDQERFNNFVDTFFRRLNSFARTRFDPLSVGLESKNSAGKKGGKSGKNKNSKGKKKKSGKKGKKAGKKSVKKDGKKADKGKKKSGRHPKDLDLGEVAPEDHEDLIVEEEEEVEVHAMGKREAEVIDVVEIEEEEEEDEVHDINKREAEVIDVVEIEEEEEEETDLEEEDEEEDSVVRDARSATLDDSEDTAVETARRGKPAKGSKKGTTKRGKNKNKGGKKQRKGNNKSGKKKNNKKSGKKGKKSKRSTKDSKPRTSRASVTGIATVRRSGDVKVSNKKGGKEMRAAFILGPVDLKVNRKFGKGKNAITKEARAVSPELTGKLSIHVAENGKARMTNFRINRPAIVQVEGNLHKSDKGGKSDNNFMERSIGRFSPIASKKLKAASREILSAGEPKAQAEK